MSLLKDSVERNVIVILTDGEDGNMKKGNIVSILVFCVLISRTGSVYPGENNPGSTSAALPSVEVILVEGLNGYIGTRDNTIYQGGQIGDNYEDNSNGKGFYLFSGNTSNNFSRRALIAFDLSTVPKGVIVLSATLELTVSKTLSGSKNQILHRLTKNWGEGATDASGQEGSGINAAPGDATWISNFHPSSLWTSPGAQGDYVTTPSASTLAGSEGAQLVFTDPRMASDVQNWIDGSLPNDGWILIGDESGSSTSKRYNSADNTEAPSVERPRLIISYTSPPLEDPIPEPMRNGPIVADLAPFLGGLVSPLGLVPAGDSTGRLFVYDQAGIVIVIQNDNVTSSTFLDVSSRLVTLSSAYDERGLLGFAPAPDFQTSGLVYTYTSEPATGIADFTTSPSVISYDHQAVIAEWKLDNIDPDKIDLASRRELIRIDEPQMNHNGGMLAFGPDGFLYIALGDGGAGDDQGDGHAPRGNGQDINNVYGKILRIDVKGNNSSNGKYGIPPDNPFVGTNGLDEIFAYGLRNPYRYSFDRQNGKLYVADVGQNDIEELDEVTTGGNYGWRYKEGTFFFEPNGTDPGYVTIAPTIPIPAGLIDPVAEYDHDEGRTIVGGYRYRGASVLLQGLYVGGDFARSFTEPSGALIYADFAAGVFRRLRIGDGTQSLGLWVKGFGEDDEGELYVCGSKNLGPSGSTGVVLKITNIRPFLTGSQGGILY